MKAIVEYFVFLADSTFFNMGNILTAILSVLFVGLLIWSLRWVYSDAEARGKDGCLVALLVFLVSWPISLLVWQAFRPSLKGKSAAQNRCHGCGAPIPPGGWRCVRCGSG